MKKLIAIIISIALVFALTSCRGDLQSPAQTTQGKTQTQPNQKTRFYSVSVLPDGNIVKAYLDDNNDINHLVKLEIVNPENDNIENTIDVSKFDMREAKIVCLNDYFYFCSGQIYVYDYSGTPIKQINYPHDIDVHFDIAQSVIAISNDLSKMAYCFLEENEEEDKFGLKLLNLETNEETVIQNLNEPVTDKPCNYNSLHFSGDDKTLMFTGQRYLKINDGRECYGVVDLEDFSIKSEFANNTECKFINNIGYVYDECVSYGKTSSGVIQCFTPDGNAEKISLENKNESQFIGLTDKENMFLSVLCDWSYYSIEIRLYENGKAIKKAKINCKSEQEFNLINVDDMCYSSKSNKAYYTSALWNGEEYLGIELTELQME